LNLTFEREPCIGRDSNVKFAPLGSERVLPAQSGKPGEVLIGGAQRQAVLDCERGEVSVGDKVRVNTAVRQ